MKIAIVGATGLVGSVMLRVLEERGFGGEEVIAAASERSVGRKVPFAGRELTVTSVEEAIAQRPRFAIFSAGAGPSREYAPRFAAAGTTVIDNSSAWRKDVDKPLVVPEINIDAVRPGDRIIANPNCSTIQMVLAVSGLHAAYGIRRLVVSTYQSVTGTGMKAIRQLEREERQGIAGDYPMAYPYPIHRNLFPLGGDFLPNDYTTEEQKLVDESRKILRDPSLLVCATVARVPVTGGHSESVCLELKRPYDMAEAKRIVAETPGVTLYDDPATLKFPMPMLTEGKDEVLVGRMRRDETVSNGLCLWITADNLRKGAATNAVQIMQALLKRAAL